MGSTEEAWCHAAELHPMLGVLATLARKAGELIRGRWGLETETEEKSPGDLVSPLDRELDQLALRTLGALTPGIKIISEESWDGRAVSLDPTWVVDPLDGTTAFLRTGSKEIPAFMAAYVERAEPCASMIYFPLVKRVFYAAAGKGAWSNGERIRWGAHGDRSWLRVNRYGDLAFESAAVSRLFAGGAPSGRFDLTTVEPPSAGMACWLTAGSALVHDNNVLKPKQGPWDLAAPLLFVREAGGAALALSGQPVSLASVEPYVVARSIELAHAAVQLASPRSAGADLRSALRLRLASSAEGPALMDFLLAHGKNEWNFIPEQAVREHGRGIAGGNVQAVVAERFGELVGLVTFLSDDSLYRDIDPPSNATAHRGYLAEAVVIPTLRGCGAGSEMLKAAIGYLAAQGVHAVYAKRHADNLASAGMMRKAGLTPLATFLDEKIRMTGSRKTTIERIVV